MSGSRYPRGVSVSSAVPSGESFAPKSVHCFVDLLVAAEGPTADWSKGDEVELVEQIHLEEVEP